MNWISVYVSKDRFKAELIKNELVNQEINAVVMDKIDGNYPVLGVVSIVVPEEQATLAKKYLETLDDQKP